MHRVFCQFLACLLLPLMALSWPLCACAAMTTDAAASPNVRATRSCCSHNPVSISNEHDKSGHDCPHCNGSASAVPAESSSVCDQINLHAMVASPLGQSVNIVALFATEIGHCSRSDRVQLFPPPIEQLYRHCALLF